MKHPATTSCLILRALLPLFIIITLILPLSAPINAGAAGDRRDLLGKGSDYTAILYDSSGGLPTSEANTILQSSDGFIWIGSYSGLIRYDGTSFERFDSSTGISSVYSLFEDSSGRIWIGTNENGIACYDHGCFRFYGQESALRSYSIRAIAQDRLGNIIIATTQGLACVGTDNELRLIDDERINMEYISSITADSSGLIYGITSNGEVFTLDRLHVVRFCDRYHFGDYTVTSVYPSPENEKIIYMGTTSTLILVVNAEDLTVKQELGTGSHANINSLLSSGGLLWTAATNGVGYFDESMNYAELDDLPMDNSVGHIMKDHEGNLWFTSTRQGVMKLVPDRFSDISSLAGLEPMVINSTLVKDGLLYLGGDTGTGLTIIDLRDYSTVENDITRFLQGVRIRCLFADAAGDIWICTKGDTGLVHCRSNGEIECLNSAAGLDCGQVRDVIQRRDKSLAVATDNGLYIVENDAVTKHYGQDDGINNLAILSVEEGPDGVLYLGSDGDGIYTIKNSRIRRLHYDAGLTSGVVMRIKYDAQRDLFWLITSNSIQYLKEGKITAVSSFPYSNNYDIFFDDNGGAWVLASNGIYITRADSLIKNENIEYSFYNLKSGLPYITTGNSRSFLDEEGKLYIAGTTGVCLVNINGNEKRNTRVRLSVPAVEIDDRIVNVPDDGLIEMPAGARRLVIRPYALTYGLANPRISYRLEGFDREAAITTKQDLAPVIYTNLDGGRYTFCLSVINDETGEAEDSLKLVITKESSVYESPLFWLLLMTLVIGSVALMIWNHFRRKNEALIKKQAEDTAFIDQILHTIAKCVDLRDTLNVGHSFRVAYYSRLIAQRMAPAYGYAQEMVDQCYYTALLHDIGKIGIPDAILNKPKGLSDDEYAIMKSHAEKGAELLKDVDIVKDLAIGAGCHHERMDGKGYPRGLKGEEIPRIARIIAVADTFDAMYSTRPYRKQMPLEEVLAEIKRISGNQLDPAVVDTLLELAADNMLDKDVVDEYVKNIKSPKKKREPDEGTKTSSKETEAEDDGSEAFMNSLGFTKKEGEKK
ncbi:MAG: HD domain-containing protein [Lachnospiraceae bacterium]|nr:HD domain-containing protein [Lachnospiraceae bacterium]